MEQALRQQVHVLEKRLKKVWELYQEELRINKMYEAKLAALANGARFENGTELPKDLQLMNERNLEPDTASSPTDGNSEGRYDEGISVSQDEEGGMHERNLDGVGTNKVIHIKDTQLRSPLVIESSVPPEVDLFVEPSQLPPWHPIENVQVVIDKEVAVVEKTPQQPKRFVVQTLPQPHEGEPVLASPDLLFDRGTASPIDAKRISEGDGNNRVDGNESVRKGKQTPGTTQKDDTMTFVSPRIVSDGISSPDLLVSGKGESGDAVSPVMMKSFVEEATHREATAETKRVKVDELPHEQGKTSAAAKYQDVVRNRAERAALPGSCCEECRKFYEGLTLREGEDLQAVMNRFSRHRHQHAHPATPEGYWDMWSLPDESVPPTPKSKPAIIGLFRPHQAVSGKTHAAASTEVSKSLSPTRPQQPQSNGPN